MSQLDPTSPNVRILKPQLQNWSPVEAASMRPAGASRMSAVANGPAAYPMSGSTRGNATASAVEPASGSPLAAATASVVSGRYRSAWQSNWQLELRVDVDGWWPTQLLSGDFFQASGATVSYFGSFYASGLSVQATDSQVTAEGNVTSTWQGPFPRVRVTITRDAVSGAPTTAVVQFLQADGTLGNAYTCSFESYYFRTVEYERDVEEGVT
jgi:hypothetical protein